MDIWSEDFRVRTWDVDRGGSLTAAAAFNYFQEIAGNHAEDLGVGREAMTQAGTAWILSRMSVVMDRRPAWGADIQVQTWPRGTQRLFALRDYELLDATGQSAVRGRSAWLVVDLSKLKPLRPQYLEENLPKNEGKDALLDGAEGLKFSEGLTLAGKRQAAYSDIDYNSHVNNARYIQWIQDCLPAEDLERAQGLRLDINYLAEVKPGELISLFTQSQQDGENSIYLVEGRWEEAEKTAFRAKLCLWYSPQ